MTTRRLVVGVDFDGTIVKCNYPYIGKYKCMALPVLRWLSTKHILVLWTCREGRLLSEALAILNGNGIEFAAINSNTFDRIREYNTDCRKLSCDVLVDDTAGWVFWPWVAVRVWLRSLRHG